LWTAGQAWLSVKLHLDILTRLCEAHDERDAIRTQISQDGYMVPGSKGQMRPHPLLGRLTVVEDQMTRWETLCGFNPAAMSKLGYAEIRAASELDKMMSRRRKTGS
jgi:P27 family predicted phage terminase small subunit